MRALVLALLFSGVPPGSEALERDVFRNVNQWRVSRSLPELRWNGNAAGQARQHSRAMASGQRPIGHDGFQDRLAKLGKQARVAAAAENVAASNGVAEVAATTVKGWAASPGHRKNMAGDFAEAGVGVAIARNGTVYVTQVFLTPSGRKSTE